MKPEESNNLLIWRVFIIFHMIPVVLLFCRMNSYAEDVVVIVNNNVPVDSLPREDIKKIFGSGNGYRQGKKIHQKSIVGSLKNMLGGRHSNIKIIGGNNFLLVEGKLPGPLTMIKLLNLY